MTTREARALKREQTRKELELSEDQDLVVFKFDGTIRVIETRKSLFASNQGMTEMFNFWRDQSTHRMDHTDYETFMGFVQHFDGTLDLSNPQVDYGKLYKLATHHNEDDLKNKLSEWGTEKIERIGDRFLLSIQEVMRTSSDPLLCDYNAQDPLYTTVKELFEKRPDLIPKVLEILTDER